jgi:Mn2+/Fe2+ NRAMP family transporter
LIWVNARSHEFAVFDNHYHLRLPGIFLMKSSDLSCPPLLQSLSWRRISVVAGPGIVVMLADTDAGSIITAAQSGAEWGYQLLLLQFILVPILYIVQELTVRLGIVERKGHAELIRDRFGRGWAWVSVATLVVACIGALLSELSGLAGVGLLMGVPAPVTMSLIVVALIVMAYKGSYLSVERIAIAVGAFEFVFLFVAWQANPDFTALASGAVDIAWREPKYLYLVAANIGAVIMPWMVFYQQSSVVEKKLTIADLPAARLDTAFGAVVTQVIMAAVLIATAATLGHGPQSGSLDTVQQIAQAITPYLGETTGKLLFGLGLSGAAVVATIVVTLTAARTLSEVLGTKHSLEHEPHEAPWFYGIYTATLIAGALIVVSGVNLVSLSVSVQVMNALLLPIVLGFLYLLARRLPQPYRLQGAYAVLVAIVVAATVIFGVYSGLSGLWG